MVSDRGCTVTGEEKDTQVFIIRIWREIRENASLPVECRGVIEHLQSGERVYIKKMDEVVNFLTPYIEAGGLPGNFNFLVRFFRKIYDSLRV
jgi:hypothetical protein